MEERPYSVRNVIKEFFDGEDYFHEEQHCKIGHIWVAKHLGFDTLIVEPIKDGQTKGQYEVAVRIWSDGMWRGYKVNEPDDIRNHYFHGVNTGGH